ncbi:hypothetical protein P7H20_19195 [Paenibacillus larvae]|nr:hypothetical protein [Paenibacillus larvae]MDT2276527.1 hypothetical protein [Paenibacillus larvae]
MPGPEMALCSGNKTLAYEVYRERTGQLAGFLKNRLGNQRDGAGVLLDDSLDKLVAFSALAAFRSGLYGPDAMNPAGQQADYRHLLPCHNEPLCVDEVDRLLWESESLQGYVLLDEYDAARESVFADAETSGKPLRKKQAKRPTITAEQATWRESVQP